VCSLQAYDSGTFFSVFLYRSLLTSYFWLKNGFLTPVDLRPLFCSLLVATYMLVYIFIVHEGLLSLQLLLLLLFNIKSEWLHFLECEKWFIYEEVICCRFYFIIFFLSNISAKEG
jgi:hypothetical protein